MNSFTLKVLQRDGTADWQFVSDIIGGKASITATRRGQADRVGVGADMYDAFRHLRTQMEPDGLRPLCVGSMPNAHPSGMVGSIGDGSLVYILRPHRRAKKTAFIFTPVAPEATGSLAEQDAFFENWARSPKYLSFGSPVVDLFRELWHRVRYR